MEVFFYHLTQKTVEDTLVPLIGRSLDAGWGVHIVGRSRGYLEWLDEKLWQGPDDGFLAHGLSGGPHDDLQPVLLAQDLPSNADGCLFLVEGQNPSSDAIAGWRRVCVVFDGGDGEQLSNARALWKSYQSSGLALKYWSDETGRWAMKAEANT